LIGASTQQASHFSEEDHFVERHDPDSVMMPSVFVGTPSSSFCSACLRTKSTIFPATSLARTLGPNFPEGFGPASRGEDLRMFPPFGTSGDSSGSLFGTLGMPFVPIVGPWCTGPRSDIFSVARLDVPALGTYSVPFQGWN